MYRYGAGKSDDTQLQEKRPSCRTQYTSCQSKQWRSKKCCSTASRKKTKLAHSVHELSKSTMKQKRSIHNCCFKVSSQHELGMTSWKRTSNSNFAAIPEQSSKPDNVMRRANKPTLADAIWVLMPTDVVEPTRQSQYVLNGVSLVHRIPWQRGTTYIQ